MPLSHPGLGLDKGTGEKPGAEFAWSRLLTRQQTHGKCEIEQGTYCSKSQGVFFPCKIGTLISSVSGDKLRHSKEPCPESRTQN